MGLEEIAAEHRLSHARRFAGVTTLRTCLQSALEGCCGRLFVDGEHAWVVAPPFFFPVGPASEAPSSLPLLRAVDRFGGVIVAEEAWLAFLEARFGQRTSRAPRTRYSPAGLSAAELRALAAPRAPEATVERLDEARAERAARDIDPSLIVAANFASARVFVERGVGFWVRVGERPVAAATSGFVCEGAIEVQVVTHPDHRGHAHGTAASAALLAHCLERGITPHWDTGNPISARMAERLGYRPAQRYHVLEIAPRGR